MLVNGQANDLRRVSAFAAAAAAATALSLMECAYYSPRRGGRNYFLGGTPSEKALL